MGDDIEQLKSVFRSLVVSSPSQVDVRSLLRDYRNMIGAPVPLSKYGHRNPTEFLKERFSDCFLFSGPMSNPVLTLIVPNTLKHIDKFVQKQKSSTTSKFNPKRRSVPEDVVRALNNNHKYQTRPPQVIEEPNKSESTSKPVITPSKSYITLSKPQVILSKSKAARSTPDIVPSQQNGAENIPHINEIIDVNENVDYKPENTPSDSSNAVKNFFKKRLPMYDSLQYLDDQSTDRFGGTVPDDDSGRHTSSSGHSAKAQQFEQLKLEVMDLIADAPDGVWCTDLIKLYKDRYKRELNFSRFGYTSIISFVYCLEERVQITRPVETGDWLLQQRSRAAPAPAALRPRRARAALPHAARTPAQHDPEDALPGIDFDPDVFPEDCMHFMESIESLSLADFRPGAMVEVMIGEVYSPSHFWFIRLGDNYNIAMEDMMDEMTHYYNNEGRDRVLARGAVRVGHYCSSLYEKDWHRSLIVKIVDSDTVKVRHVDYGTVDTVPLAALKPLRREWGALPAQATRARLAAARPPAAGWRWPHAACAAFLQLVSDRRLVANVVARDDRDRVAEVLLIDTSSDEDVCIGTELIRAGHADSRPDSALRTLDVYLYPRFDALETGATPNYAEVRAYLRDGIALDYVHAYRDHVPALRAAPAPASPASPAPSETPSSSTESDSVLNVSKKTRIPLLLPDSASITRSAPALSESLPEPLPESEPEPEPEPESELEPEPEPETAALPAVLQVADSQPPAPVGLPPPPPPSFLSPHAPAYVPGAPYPRAQRAPGPAAHARSPPPPYGGPAPGVTLSLAECETYRVLSHVNPAAAHWFMVGALGRAMSVPVPPRPMPPPHAAYQPPRHTPVNVQHMPASHMPASYMPASHMPASHMPASHMPASHMPAPHMSAPHMPAPHMSAPHMSAPHMPAPHMPAPHMSAPNMPAPHMPGPTPSISRIQPPPGFGF